MTRKRSCVSARSRRPRTGPGPHAISRVSARTRSEWPCSQRSWPRALRRASVRLVQECPWAAGLLEGRLGIALLNGRDAGPRAAGMPGRSGDRDCLLLVESEAPRCGGRPPVGRGSSGPDDIVGHPRAARESVDTGRRSVAAVAPGPFEGLPGSRRTGVKISLRHVEASAAMLSISGL